MQAQRLQTGRRHAAKFISSDVADFYLFSHLSPSLEPQLLTQLLIMETTLLTPKQMNGARHASTNATNDAFLKQLLLMLTAMREGDFSARITSDWLGLEGKVTDAINQIATRMERSNKNIVRLRREVGQEGKIGERLALGDSVGDWAERVEAINALVDELSQPTIEMGRVIGAVAKGDLSQTMPTETSGRPLCGEYLRTAKLVNGMVDQLGSFSVEVIRVAREVGSEGKLGGQAVVPGVAGTWKDLTDSVNAMASNLTSQVRNIAGVTTAVARGDLSRKITVDVKGEILELKETINTMVDRLNAFASEVSRVAREVGTDGNLGGQAVVPGIAGTWKDLTDNVNSMANNLTSQVRNIAEVTTAVAKGDLSRKITVDARGEILELKNTINTMVDQLNGFASEVSRVAREVGTDGKLGGQAFVPGVAGTWKDLTGNVNLLAANLTTQVRAIAEVATAVTKGDLTRSIQVDARGEVAELKDNINTMIYNLRVTTETNQEQDWLKTNIAKFTRMLQGQRDLFTVGKTLLSELAPLVEANQGTIYQVHDDGSAKPMLRLLAGYARPGGQPEQIPLGEGLVGQCALEQQRIMLNKVPENYTRIQSSLGEAAPVSIVVFPMIFEGETKAVIELASLRPFNVTHLTFLEQLTQSIGVVLNTIEATMRTEGLLQQSQQLTVELQSRQKELTQTNEELAEKARQLAEQNAEVERKNQEVEQAHSALEEKAAELALTSKYKSEFLANMSHELRTPLNSILILGQQLAENAGGNLTTKQTEFARNIHSSGSDLLNLITDILDLSKIESGTVTVDAEEINFSSLHDSVERNFRHVADSKNLPFQVNFNPNLPRTLTTDPKRLQQILKNLLSNAFKFTAHGQVAVTVRLVEDGWTPGHSKLSRARNVVMFAINDTGIGIAPEKQKLIFEAFQQADAGTSRKYGGTGLGLAISRELAALLGGEIRLQSTPGVGSTFSLYLPLFYMDVGTVSEKIHPTYTAPITLPVAREDFIADDREQIQSGDQVLLIVEDDPHYGRVLLGLAREKGFKAIVANRGNAAIALARQYKPTAITLDIFLPDMLGWTVLNNLKLSPETRHIPVQIVSVEEERQHGLAHGAFSYTVKPATTEGLEQCFNRIKNFVVPRTKRLLVVEDNEVEAKSIVELISHDDIEIVTASTGAEAMQKLLDSPFDCCVLDLRLPDMTGFELLEKLQAEQTLRDIPIVVFTGKQLTAEEESHLRSAAKSIVLKDVKSPERLFDETALFLHRVVSNLPENQRKMIDTLHASSEVLRGRKVLIVDDDARNIFALTTMLENQEMNVISATNGRQAIGMMQDQPDVGVVLMDIMMPEMDGYETMREIRQNPQFGALPILALTARAMKGDREKCLAAGASDYIAKPVNTNELLSLLRVWLYR